MRWNVVAYFLDAIDKINLCSNRTCCAKIVNMEHHFPPLVRVRFPVLETHEWTWFPGHVRSWTWFASRTFSNIRKKLAEVDEKLRIRSVPLFLANRGLMLSRSSISRMNWDFSRQCDSPSAFSRPLCPLNVKLGHGKMREWIQRTWLDLLARYVISWWKNTVFPHASWYYCR